MSYGSNEDGNGPAIGCEAASGDSTCDSTNDYGTFGTQRGFERGMASTTRLQRHPAAVD